MHPKKFLVRLLGCNLNYNEICDSTFCFRYAVSKYLFLILLVFAKINYKATRLSTLRFCFNPQHRVF